MIAAARRALLLFATSVVMTLGAAGAQAQSDSTANAAESTAQPAAEAAEASGLPV